MNHKSTIFVIFLAALIFLASFSIAQRAFLQSSPTINEQVNSFFNITVNNTQEGFNITQVNITLPSGFTFNANAYGTGVASNYTFYTASSGVTVLTWNTSTGLLVRNFTNQSFWFNATANTTTIGTFLLNVSIMNNATNVTTYSLPVTVNDTSSPSNVSFIGDTNSTGVNVSSNFVSINVAAFDNFNISSLNLTLYNGSLQLVNSTVFLSGTASLNVSGLAEGVYYYNATALDNAGNMNKTETRNITLDTTAPTVTFTSNPDSTTYTEVFMKVVAYDNLSGIYSCSVNNGFAISPSSWTGLNQDVTETKQSSSASLVCGHSISRTVVCIDNAGNSRSVSLTTSTTSCPSSSSSSSSSSSGTTDTTSTNWTSTYYQTTKDISDLGDVNQVLAAKERLGIKVSGVLHNVGVTSLSSNSATIDVESTPQIATLNVGDEKSFEINGDNYYDIKVTLNSIKYSKANFTISYTHEAMTQAQQAASNAAKANVNTTQQNSSITSSPSALALSGAKSWIWWSLGVLAVLIIVAVAWVVIRKRKLFRRRK